MTLYELSLALASLALLGLYHAHFVRQLALSPDATTVGRSRRHRRAWVTDIVARRDGILAVQTLRNWSTTASFLASTAIIIAAGLLGFLVSAEKISVLVHAFNLLGSQSTSLLTLKLLLLICDFMATFFSFSLCLRYYNYVALTINTPPGERGDETVTLSIDYLERAARHFTIGMRGYYLSIPIGLWLLGPLWLFGGSIILVLVLYRHDHAG